MQIYPTNIYLFQSYFKIISPINQYTLFAGGTDANSDSSNVFNLTGLYSITTFPVFKSGINEFVCIIKLASSLSW